MPRRGGRSAAIAAMIAVRHRPSATIAAVPDVTYVVVTFRSAADIAACLDAIDADRTPDQPIVVIDNASDDASASLATAHPSRPTVIVRAVNDGFGTACNVGAAATDADAIFFVNPDAFLVAGVTRRLLGALAMDPRIAAVGPSIVDPAGHYRA